MNILENAKKILRAESTEILWLAVNLNKTFEQVVKLILNNKSRVVLLGVGKSAIIGQKIAATLSSTGTPAFFIHGSDAGHGSLGGIMENDIVIIISNSGNTAELIQLLPLLKALGTIIIVITGDKKSALARAANYILPVTAKEVVDLVPTSSTTAVLALGDALAVTLMELNGRTTADFKRSHPAGQIGGQNNAKR